MAGEVYESIMRGLNEALRHARGEEVPGLVVHHPPALADNDAWQVERIARGIEAVHDAKAAPASGCVEV